MGNKKVFCPFCGEWNGHPDGVVMREDGNGIASPQRFGYPEQFWYYCPVCGSETPCEKSREAALTAALRRFTPPQKPLTYEQTKERAAQNAAVYVIAGSGYEGWALLSICEKYGDAENVNYQYPGGELVAESSNGDNTLDGDFYGLREAGGITPHFLGWIAFDRKPNAREIAAADWRVIK